MKTVETDDFIKTRQKFGKLFLILTILFILPATGSNLQAAEINFFAEPFENGKPMIEPADLFKGFPAVTFGMNFATAKKILEDGKLRPVGFRDSQAELAWDGQFNQMSGRGTVLFREGGIYEIAAVIYAMKKQRTVFEDFKKKIIAKHGATKEIADDEYGISYVWRLKNGFVIELRKMKDVNNPVVDVHWVKSA